MATRAPAPAPPVLDDRNYVTTVANETPGLIRIVKHAQTHTLHRIESANVMVLTEIMYFDLANHVTR